MIDPHPELERVRLCLGPEVNLLPDPLGKGVARLFQLPVLPEGRERLVQKPEHTHPGNDLDLDRVAQKAFAQVLSPGCFRRGTTFSAITVACHAEVSDLVLDTCDGMA